MADPKSIDEALLVLQRMNITVKKTARGAVRAGKTDKYADLPAVNAQVLVALNDLGVTWTCLPTLLPDTASGPGKFVLRYELLHVASETNKTGDWPLGAGEPQKMGSAVTYARRYALLAVTGIAAEDDDDDGAAASGQRHAQRAGQRPRQQEASDEPAQVSRTAQRRSQPARGARPALPGEDPDGPVGADQHKHMHALWRDLGAGGDERRDFRLKKIAEWLDLPELDSSANLTRAQASTVIDRLKERKAATAQVPDGGSA